MVTKWEYSLKTEAERLLHCARQIAVGFYKVNNFVVLPYGIKDQGINTVTFPDLPYNTIQRFWKKVSFIDIVNLPIKVPASLVSQTANILETAKLPIPDFSKIKAVWEKAEKDVVNEIYKIMPVYTNRIKKIVIYPTVFGTGSSFNLIGKDGVIRVYLRSDKGIATIAEAVVTALTRADVYNDLDGIWQESEMITDWLITKSSLSKVIKRYDKSFSYQPTIKGTRAKQQAKLLAQSEAFYKKLGVPLTNRPFGCNGLMPELFGKPVQNLTVNERKVLLDLIKNSNNVTGLDEIGNMIFENESKFSLYAITKLIQRLRSKLEANGISGSYIQTLRGRGYLLKN